MQVWRRGRFESMSVNHPLNLRGNRSKHPISMVNRIYSNK